MLLRRSRVSGAITKEAFINPMARFVGGMAKGVARPLVQNPMPAKTLSGKAGVLAGRVARKAAIPAAVLGTVGYGLHSTLRSGFDQSRLGMDRRYLAAQNRGYVP